MRLFADTRDELGESPIWSPIDESVYWIDLFRCVLHRVSISGELSTRDIQLPPPLGAMVPSEHGRALLLAGRSVFDLDLSSGSFDSEVRADRIPAGTHYNDAATDRRGGLWGISADDAEREAKGVLQSLESLTTTTWASGFVVGNGPAFSPSGDVLYASDTMAGAIRQFSVTPHGGLVPCGLLATFEPEAGLPDGLAVDADGCIWVALWGGESIVRLSAHGEVLERREVPALNVTSLAFGGERLDHLFITTASMDTPARERRRFPCAGGLFETMTDVPGLACVPAAELRAP